MSHSLRRLVATGAALCALILLPAAARAAALPPSTWVALGSLPSSKPGTIFGLAVNPASPAQLVAGDSNGMIFRSTDTGATWSSVYTAKSAILTVAYDALTPGIVLAGTQSGGVLVSKDAGAHWSPAAGTDGHAVRAVAFARATMFAATDHGVYSSADGSTWASSGLPTASIDAIAVLAVNDPVKLVAGGDSTSGSLPMYVSVDGGATWGNLSPAISGTVVTKLAAGPLPPGSQVRPLLVGTNTGLFISADGGSSFTPLSGAQLLPSIDYTQAAFTSSHSDRFFVASDGGGAGAGGLWATADSGQHFSSLQPPLPSITSMAVSPDEQPVVFIATFRAYDHAAMLWAFRDTGGTPQGPFIYVSPTATAARTSGQGTPLMDLVRSLASSQAPYIALGVIALGLIVLAAVAHFRSRRR